MTWDQLGEIHARRLATLGNQTDSHARPQHRSAAQLSRCTAELQRHLGVVPRHFAYTWGIDVPAAHHLLAERFRTAATGELGRNFPSAASTSWRRIPVRGSDSLPFFRAKLRGFLRAERAYERIVARAKPVGVPA